MSKCIHYNSYTHAYPAFIYACVQHIHTYIHTYTLIRIQAHQSQLIYAWLYHIYVAQSNICICMFVCVYVHVYVCLYVSNVCIHMNIPCTCTIVIYICVYVCLYVYMYMYTYICMCLMCVYTCIYHLHVPQSYTYVYMYVCTCLMCVYTVHEAAVHHIHTYIHTYTRIHIHIHTYPPIRIHVHKSHFIHTWIYHIYAPQCMCLLRVWTVQEASWWWGFDPLYILLFDLYHWSELMYFLMCTTNKRSGVDIRWFPVDGVDTRWIPKSFLRGYIHIHANIHNTYKHTYITIHQRSTYHLFVQG